MCSLPNAAPVCRSDTAAVRGRTGERRWGTFRELEAVVVDGFWSADDTITARQVYGELLRDRKSAYTTVMTTMANRHRKGWLRAGATRLSRLAQRRGSGSGGGAVGR